MRFDARLLSIARALIIIIAGAGLASADEDVTFNRDILPILAENCFACHGPDAAARKAKLRLDKPEGAFAERKSGAPITPGD